MRAETQYLILRRQKEPATYEMGETMQNIFKIHNRNCLLEYWDFFFFKFKKR